MFLVLFLNFSLFFAQFEHVNVFQSQIRSPVTFKIKLSVTRVNTLAVKLETTHKPVKSPTNQPNRPQTSHKPAKPSKNQPNHPQTIQKPAKPLTKQSNIGQITQKPAIYEQKISFMLPKTLVRMENLS